MAITEAQNPPVAARCVSCGQKFRDDLQRPYVDLGAFQDGPVEKLDGFKQWAHEDVIVCGACLRKAADVLPEVSDHQRGLLLRATQAEAQRDAAVLAQQHLVEYVDQRLEAIAPVDLQELDQKQLRAEAKRRGVDLGRGNHSKDTLIDLIEGRQSAS